MMETTLIAPSQITRGGKPRGDGEGSVQVQPWVYKQLTEAFVLDPAMRERLAALNPTASLRMANRLIEASERNYWQPDAATLEALKQAGEELEDRLEGVQTGVAA